MFLPQFAAAAAARDKTFTRFVYLELKISAGVRPGVSRWQAAGSGSSPSQAEAAVQPGTALVSWIDH